MLTSGITNTDLTNKVNLNSNFIGCFALCCVLCYVVLVLCCVYGMMCFVLCCVCGGTHRACCLMVVGNQMEIRHLETGHQ